MDKLFLQIAGEPVVAHSWRRFEAAPEIAELVIVVRDGSQARFEALAREHGFRKPHRFVVGGAERQDSVWAGINAVSPGCELVAIHDAARPCVTPELIAATLAAANDTGASVAAQRVIDTIKESEDGVRISRHLDRTRLWAVQTPQCFRLEVIRRALAAVRDRGLRVTDDTAACELIGQPVRLVESAAPNPKITSPSDVAFAEVCLRAVG